MSEKERGILSRIPEDERHVYQSMTQLKSEDKHLLWELIKDTNKENVTLYTGDLEKLHELLNKQLIHINTAYKTRDKKVSLFVLNRAPYLIRLLKREYLD
ncbi:hypothetical protein [Piscibacillus salipiscarius]|uniref:Uncharacterized protein n=1 Tax=Piscibacillus salipiscarius TaxID=299480 RepID=A0ABW5Q7N2_9BACI|nr:hypothetical protein [Piscibacillus salipiscarius]